MLGSLPSILIHPASRESEQELNLQPVGSVTKCDGTNGAVLVKIGPDVDAAGVFSSDFLFLMIDYGIVPMRIEEVTKRGSRSATVKLVSISDVKGASFLVGATVHAVVEDDGTDEEETPLIGYSCIDVVAGELGILEDIDESVAANPLFVIRRTDGSELLVPAQEAFIDSVDDSAQTLTLCLPVGLVDISLAEEE